ncbi:hypothetical protein SAMN05445850_4492 [Paraburkholderia tuberum]|uniref:Uncharacterized protein n=1 Tax=Paraburkholderia tuberum TaxID=157910 RepID=A0A1H1JAR8_9BURK|nr:hypothetical protein SAMN05445850_4492 [Paraburkholderia tuberum]
MLTAAPPGIAIGAVVLDTAFVALAIRSLIMYAPKKKNRLKGGWRLLLM